MRALVAGIERREGFTLIELLVVVAIIGLLAALAAPGLLRARMSGNETSATASLRAIVVAQASYANTCASGAYATLLLNLAVGPGGSPEGFLSPDLGLTPIPIKSGYRFNVAPGAGSLAAAADCNGQPTRTTYYVSAVPTIPGATGVRGFATNQGGSIWQDLSGAAPVEPFAIGPGVTPVQ
jgi:prepilin-type N-terminal cleavage/methylation domain-containing protein